MTGKGVRVTVTIKDGDETLRIRGTMKRLDAIEIGNEATALCDLYIKAKAEERRM